MTTSDPLVIAAGSALIGLVIGYFFKRWNRDYVTAGACRQCKTDRKDNDNDFRREMREKLGIMTGVLVVIAAGKEVSLEEIQKLVAIGSTPR